MAEGKGGRRTARAAGSGESGGPEMSLFQRRRASERAKMVAKRMQ